MRFNRTLGLIAVMAGTIIGNAPHAQAWTRTVVHSARASVDVERDATVYVLLRLDVEVHAGWLHELELVDLGPGVELDRYRPPYFRSEDGEVFRPEAELDEDGRIRLSFARREAPRRGAYRVYIRYRTPADVTAVEVDGVSQARIVWSVPAWETGLHGVSVEFRTPKGTRVPAEMQDTPPGMTYEIIEAPKRTIVRWRRIHLPRMTPWPLALDAPAGTIATPAETPQPARVPGFEPLETSEDRPIAWALLLLAAIVLLKRRSIEARLGRGSLWLPIGWPWVLAGTIVLASAAQWLAPTELAWGLPLVLLVLHGPAQLPVIPGMQSYEPNPPAKRRPANALSWLDGTTATGAIAMVACGVLLFTLQQPAGALLLIPVFMLGTRLHLPPNAEESTRALRNFVGSLRIADDSPPVSFRWELGADGSPRVRLHLLRTRPGTQSISFVAASSLLGLGRVRRVMMLVETRLQSDADDVLRRRRCSASEYRSEDGSVFRLVEWDRGAVEVLRALASERPGPAKASRGTWLLREMSEPRRKAA